MSAVDPNAEREAMARVISAALAMDREGFGSCDFSRDLADALRAAGFGDVAAERARAFDEGVSAKSKQSQIGPEQGQPVVNPYRAALTVDEPVPTPEPQPERATVTFMGQTEERVCSNPEPHDAHTWAIGARLRWVCPGSMQPAPEPPHLDPLPIESDGLGDRIAFNAHRWSRLRGRPEVRCDTCGKFRKSDDLIRRPVTQADYLFGDPGPFYDCKEGHS